MTAQTETRPVQDQGPAPSDTPPAVSEAARMLAKHRWRREYAHCLGQLLLDEVLQGTEGFTPDPEADR
jgi:hypothetical protein